MEAENEMLLLENGNASEPSEKHKKKKSKKKKVAHEEEEELVLQADYQQVEMPKKKKKKSKHAAEEYNVDEASTSGTNNVEYSVKPKKKHYVENDEDDIPTEHADEDHNEGVINMPLFDIPKLLSRIEAVLPENDNMSYSTREKKLNWEEIAFKDYSAERCRDVWLAVSKKQRHYRHLKEIIDDAKIWLQKPWTDYRNTLKQHPEFPKKPQTSYMLFFMDYKDQALAENPNIKLADLSRLVAQKFTNLSAPVKEKYVQLAALKKKQYEHDVDLFYEKHPEVPRNTVTEKEKKAQRRLETPFMLFYNNMLKSATPEELHDKLAFRESCKESWKNLSDKRKLAWIDMALELHAKHEYDNPEAEHKDILSREERMLKSRLEGRPDKPPVTAYGLFARKFMTSEEFKQFDNKEKIKVVSVRWKELPEEQKQIYRTEHEQMQAKYKEDYAQYLASLPEAKRELEIQLANNSKKRPLKPGEKHLKEATLAKKRKLESDTDEEDIEKYHAELIKCATPDTWEEMKVPERTMYMQYLQKIKNYFDVQHSSVAIERACQDAMSDSDSNTTTENSD